MGINIKIAKAKRRELAEISRILREEYEKHPYYETWTKETALDRIKDFFKWHETYVARDSNEILGFIITETFMWGDKKKGMIDELVISSSHQSKGVGTKLMNYAEVALKREGAKSIVLSAHKKAKALDFYKKRGYRPADYVEMEKDL